MVNPELKLFLDLEHEGRNRSYASILLVRRSFPGSTLAATPSSLQIPPGRAESFSPSRSC
jgi:hypothetical protein